VASQNIHVAVGVVRNKRGEVLVSRRPEHAHQGGLWEFPGGKVESGEWVRTALERELKEELGITVMAARPLIQINHAYPDKQVLLDVWWVDRYEGEPAGLEDQPLDWVSAPALRERDFPAADAPIIDAIIQAN
jgi:8-oxo-dGTP diphosphatase